jgi:SAM-dependent methyltransferase
MSDMHFERIARDYDSARPPYPPVLYETLRAAGVIGPHTRVLEVGAGTGLATREVVDSGSEVVALEPGPGLAELLGVHIPRASVVVSRLEDAELPACSFDSAIAATSMHWVNLSIALPKIHAALRPQGWLAVWRTIFGDDSIQTPFRRRVDQIVARQTREGAGMPRARGGPSMEELASGGWFEPVRSELWRWSVELSPDEVRQLFRTFSDWSGAGADLAAQAADDLGGQVTEHYQTVLHLLSAVGTQHSSDCA